MPLAPAITTAVTITAVDINGNSIAKQFNAVSALNFDYFKGMVNVVDVTGSFYFSLTVITSLTYTVAGTVTTVVLS